MAIRFDISNFTAQLLAPLPDTGEQVNSDTFRRQIKNDIKAAWHPVWLKFRIARQYREAAMSERAYARKYGTLTDAMEAEGERRHEDLLEAVDNLMECPAPTKTDLKEKTGLQKFAGGCPEWDRLIALDQERLNKGAV